MKCAPIGSLIIFFAYSLSLELPPQGVEELARQGTVQAAKKLFPAFEVEGFSAKQ